MQVILGLIINWHKILASLSLLIRKSMNLISCVIPHESFKKENYRAASYNLGYCNISLVGFLPIESHTETNPCATTAT